MCSVLAPLSKEIPITKNSKNTKIQAKVQRSGEQLACCSCFVKPTTVVFGAAVLQRILRREYLRWIEKCTENLPGQVMVLHSFASELAPGHAEPFEPVVTITFIVIRLEHERYRADLPLPQLLLQLVQDPQLDQVTKAKMSSL